MPSRLKPAQPVAILAVQTDLGTFSAHYSRHGLARLDFPAQGQAGFFEAGGQSESIRRRHQATCAAVREVLQGRTPGKLPALDLQQGTAFQRRVWEALIAIPPGQTITYGELAARIGAAGAARAAGAACGANAIPLLIPCHRVIASNGALGGFSGGLHWKRKLLAGESKFQRRGTTEVAKEEREIHVQTNSRARCNERGSKTTAVRVPPAY